MLETTLAHVVDRLRAPFPPGEEQYRVGPCWEQNGDRFTRPLAFIDARAVFDRLDEVVGPGNWSTDLERVAPGVFICRMTVLGVTRADVGMAGASESEAEKSGVSDAIKRVAVQFGIGRYLYSMELPPVKLERRGSEWVLPRGWRPARQGSADKTVPFQTAAETLATAKQLGKIAVELERLGWNADRGRDYLVRAFGKRSRRELTSAEASRFIDALVAMPSPPAAL